MPNVLHCNLQSDVDPKDLAGIQGLLEKGGPGTRVVHDSRLAVNSVLLETHEYVPVEEPLVIQGMDFKEVEVDEDDAAPHVTRGIFQDNRAKDDGPLTMPTMDFGGVNNGADDGPLTMPTMD